MGKVFRHEDGEHGQFQVGLTQRHEWEEARVEKHQQFQEFREGEEQPDVGISPNSEHPIPYYKLENG